MTSKEQGSFADEPTVGAPLSCQPQGQPSPDGAVSPVLKNGPELWGKVLASLPAGAIVAGGAVRDHLLGVEPKDIDVFLPVDAWPSNGFSGFQTLGADKDAEYEAMPTIAVVVRGERLGYQVDVVGIYAERTTPADIVGTFDFGIARSWFDGERIHDTPEAAQDRAARTVTRLLHDRPERGEARFARFNARMGGAFTYVIAPPPETPAPAAGTSALRLAAGSHPPAEDRRSRETFK